MTNINEIVQSMIGSFINDDNLDICEITTAYAVNSCWFNYGKRLMLILSFIIKLLNSI